MYRRNVFTGGVAVAVYCPRCAANPAVLLLDEITANLDAETEARVLAALRRASRGRTVLSISHRIYENLGGRTVHIGKSDAPNLEERMHGAGAAAVSKL